MADEGWEELERHLVHSTALPAPVVRRLILEVVAYFDESPETFVRRRHRQLRSDGRANTEIYPRLAAELEARPVRGPRLTERQIRRIIYG